MGKKTPNTCLKPQHDCSRNLLVSSARHARLGDCKQPALIGVTRETRPLGCSTIQEAAGARKAFGLALSGLYWQCYCINARARDQSAQSMLCWLKMEKS